MFSAHSFNLTEPQYPAGADDNLLVIVQIESRQGVENVEEIAAVDGIDVLFIGGCYLGLIRLRISRLGSPARGGILAGRGKLYGNS